MATTTNVSVPSDWTMVLSGPTTETVSVESVSSSAQISIATALPSESLSGFRISPGETYNITLLASEILYARSIRDTVTLVLNS